MEILHHATIRVFSKARIPYYKNSTATFSVPLLSCGDINPNPGPSTSQNQPTTKNISCILCNTRSTRNKCQELETFLNCTSADLICFTKTWLTTNDTVSNLGFPEDYLLIIIIAIYCICIAPTAGQPLSA